MKWVMRVIMNEMVMRVIKMIVKIMMIVEANDDS